MPRRLPEVSIHPSGATSVEPTPKIAGQDYPRPHAGIAYMHGHDRRCLLAHGLAEVVRAVIIHHDECALNDAAAQCTKNARTPCTICESATCVKQMVGRLAVCVKECTDTGGQ